MKYSVEDYINCNGEYINDCPWPNCKCAKLKLDENEKNDKQSNNMGWGCASWIVFIILIIAFLLAL